MNKKKLVVTIAITSLIVMTGILYIILMNNNDNGQTYFVDSKEVSDSKTGNAQDIGEDIKDALMDNLKKEDELSLTTDSSQGASVGKNTTESNEPTLIYVHICGAVNNSGVYEVKENSRVIDLVDCAGGMTEDAAKDYMNLAQVVTDGQRIYIPTKEEIKELTLLEAMNGSQLEGETAELPSDYSNSQSNTSNSQSNYSSGLVNINEASKEQLMTLPGIGESKANSILRYREQNGRFSTIEDIMSVNGIKEGVFGNICDYITVN